MKKVEVEIVMNLVENEDFFVKRKIYKGDVTSYLNKIENKSKILYISETQTSLQISGFDTSRNVWYKIEIRHYHG